ncbi:single-stranded DNA-binding protein [Microbacterium sp. 22195]|uniref:single-stranded DNA-binding protein n=1 Tax=Microbacterium sp. 22195 TaxID=3453891 RepID=UPI003F82D1BF
MSKATTTVEGFVANELEVRDVNGHRVVKVTVPHTPRKFNKQTNQWEDAGETAWFTASFWDEQADVIVAGVAKRDLVTITGQPVPRAYQKQDGSIAVETDLKFATLGVIPRPSDRSQGRSGTPNAQSTSDEPWSTPGGAQSDAWSTPGSFGDDTPF